MTMFASANPTRRARPLILLIEDNVTQLDLYAMVLEGELSVIGATRGEQGIELAVSERPDLIVVDVVLPDLDGLAVTERLRADVRTASIPMIVLTGDDAAYARAHLRRDLMADVLLKPCPGDRLLASIRMALDEG
jgi:CheY-like chemotaxis protein